MGKRPVISSTENYGINKIGICSKDEDEKLVNHIEKHGHGSSWRELAQLSGLNRCGKSCGLRWNNYLKPDIRKGNLTPDEEQTILHIHSILGNKWSAIASDLPRRTNNEIKNPLNTRLKKRLIKMGIDPTTHQPMFNADVCSLVYQLQALRQASVDDQNYCLDERAMMFRSEAIKLAQLWLNLLLQFAHPAASTDPATSSSSLMNTMQIHPEMIMNSVQTTMDHHHSDTLFPNIAENDDQLLLQYIDNPPPMFHCHSHFTGENSLGNSLGWTSASVSHL